MVAVVTAITVSCVIGLRWTDYPVRPEEFGRGLFFLLPTTGLALAFSAFGMTGVGATELFAYPYWCIEKGYARAVGPRSDDPEWGRRARGWLGVMQLDAWFSCLVFTVATVAFYILGAAVLKPQGLRPQGADMIRTLSQMYIQPLGLWTRDVFLVGAWAVLFKTLYVATAANSRLTVDFLDLAGIWKIRSDRMRERAVRTFCVVYPLLALGLFFAFREPKGLVAVGGFAQGLILPLIAGAAIFLRNRDTDRRVGPLFSTDILVWIAFFVIAGVAGYTLFDLLGKTWASVMT